MQSTKLCSIDGCENLPHGYGWCLLHYSRWRRHGDPTHIKARHFRSSSLEERFAAYTEWDNDCLVWVGQKDKDGYGRMWNGEREMNAHRYAWQRTHGPIPAGMMIDHTDHCRPDCCNVNHLRLATNAENQANRLGADAKNVGSRTRNVYKSGSRWVVRVKKSGVNHYFGTHSTIEEAAAVAERARVDLFGEFAGSG